VEHFRRAESRSVDALGNIEGTKLRPGKNLLDPLGQGRDYTAEMARNLFPIGPIATAQFSSDVLVRFRYKTENGLIAFLAFIFRVKEQSYKTAAIQSTSISNPPVPSRNINNKDARGRIFREITPVDGIHRSEHVY